MLYGMPVHSASAEPSVALIHDALVNMGGAERVLLDLVASFPEAPIYTSALNVATTFDAFGRIPIRAALGSRIALSERTLKALWPLWVLWFRTLDLSAYDVVFTSAAFAAKSVQTKPNQCHICLCWSPFRLAWRPEDYCHGRGRASRTLLLAVARLLRRYDRAAARSVDYFVASCRNVEERIWRCYGRRSTVINPPVRCAMYRVARTPGDYYLIVSRLNRYKRVDLAVDAFAGSDRQLVIVGEGPDRPLLQGRGSSNVRFLGSVADQELRELYANCRALIFPQEEDYGLTPLEAQASGRPVIGYAAGGILETVVDGVTGVLFSEQSVDGLRSAIAQFESTRFDPQTIRRHAEQFDAPKFVDSIRTFVKDCWHKHQSISTERGPRGL
jgi:glycosyltransferase involved in cell wall biosynthesis